MQANKIYKTFSNLKFSITSYNPTWNQKVLDSFYYYFTLKKIPFLLPASIVGPSLPGGPGAHACWITKPAEEPRTNKMHPLLPNHCACDTPPSNQVRLFLINF